MEKKHRLCIVEDHRLYRECVKAMLAQDQEWDVIGDAAGGFEATRLIMRSTPDLVLLLDPSTPRMDAFSVLREIKHSVPEIKVLVLSIHGSVQMVLQALAADADGYVVKNSSPEEMKLAIRTVLEGKMYLNPWIAVNVLERVLTWRKSLRRSALPKKVLPFRFSRLLQPPAFV